MMARPDDPHTIAGLPWLRPIAQTIEPITAELKSEANADPAFRPAVRNGSTPATTKAKQQVPDTGSVVPSIPLLPFAAPTVEAPQQVPASIEPRATPRVQNRGTDASSLAVNNAATEVDPKPARSPPENSDIPRDLSIQVKLTPGTASQNVEAAHPGVATDQAATQPQAAPPVPVSQQPESDIKSVSTERKTGPHEVIGTLNTRGKIAEEVSYQSMATPEAPLAAPVTSTASVAAPTQTAHGLSPTGQITPTLVTLARTTNGAQQMTVRLHPVELGMVQVRIERTASGLTHIDISADRPETLLALQHDQPALERTLDQAGVPAAGRTVSFHAVPPPPTSSSGGYASGGQDDRQHASPGRPDYLNTNADDSPGGGSRGGNFAREGNRWATPREQATGPDENRMKTPIEKRIYRAGLDITA